MDGAKKAHAYSILTDASCDISSKEQLSIDIKYFDEEKIVICEVFRFYRISCHGCKIYSLCCDNLGIGLEQDKCVGQGYDGFSTMSDKNGVQKIMREKYTKLCFHCANHKLNRVVNDLNKIADIRNTFLFCSEVVMCLKVNCLMLTNVI